MAVRIDGNLKHIADAARVPAQPAKDLVSEGYDAHDARYRKEAFAALLQHRPTMSQWNPDQWTFDATSLSELLRMQQRLALPLPGGTPHVLFALPPSEEVTAMHTAWDPGRRPTIIEHSDAARLMEGYRGKTLIVIGHMQGDRQDTLTAALADGSPVSFSVAELSELARQKGVLFIPIGCKSAGSAAVGFKHLIDDTQVVRFLGKLQSQRDNMGDVLTAMSEIGPVQVNGARTDRMLQAVVKSRESMPNRGGGASDKDLAASIVTVADAAELALPGDATGGVDALAQELDKLTDDARPWFDRGPLRWWWQAFRSQPLATLLASAANFVVAGVLVARAGMRWNAPAARPRPRMVRLALALFTVSAGILAWSAILALVTSNLVLALLYSAGLAWLGYRLRGPAGRLWTHAAFV